MLQCSKFKGEKRGDATCCVEVQDRVAATTGQYAHARILCHQCPEGSPPRENDKRVHTLYSACTRVVCTGPIAVPVTMSHHLVVLSALCLLVGTVRGDYLITNVYPGTECTGDVVATQVQYPTGCNDVGLHQSYSLKCTNGSAAIYVHASRHCGDTGNLTGIFPGGCRANPLHDALGQFATPSSGFAMCVSSPVRYVPPAPTAAFSVAIFNRLATCPHSLEAGDAVGAVTSAAPYRRCVRTGTSSSLTFDCNASSFFASVYDSSER